MRLQRIILSGVQMWHTRCTIGKWREGNARSGRRQNSFSWVCVKLFWRVIYCANLRTEPDYQSLSLSCKILGRWSPQIMCEYDRVTAIEVRPLIQPHMCEMGYSIFAVMVRLRLSSKTRASFPRMTSTERINWGKYFHFLCQCLLCLSLFSFYHWYRSNFIGSLF